jgi:hypothetical protein
LGNGWVPWYVTGGPTGDLRAPPSRLLARGGDSYWPKRPLRFGG